MANRPDGYELVRVSKELIDELTMRESEPVVVVSVNRFEDDTLELVLRTVERED